MTKHFLIVISTLFIFLPLFAYADPPSRVARLSAIEGTTLFSPAGEKAWIRAKINRPLIAGDRLWVNEQSKAELQLGEATLCIDSATSVTLFNLNDRLAQFKISQGKVNLYVRHIKQGQKVEIDTPNLAFIIKKAGYYRIVVESKKAATIVNVQRGGGDAYGEGAAYRINSGKSFRFTGTDLRHYQSISFPQSQFDRVCLDRAQRPAKHSIRYVSPEVIGYEDLDHYGKWIAIKEYGHAWMPTDIDKAWAPYRNGHWAWIEPWGWTWIDDKPWGFAPFHYGRWVHHNRHWYWVPGPKKAPAVYAPALVGFIGGNRFSLTLSTGGPKGIAWFPLGPRDVYEPPYTVSENYFIMINTSNAPINQTIVTQVYQNPQAQTTYQNQSVPQAVTAVPTTVFVASQPIAKEMVTLSEEEISKAKVTQTATVTPTQNSVLGTSQTEKNTPSEEIIATPVIVQTQPAPENAEFSEKAPKLAKDPGKPLEEVISNSPEESKSQEIKIVKPTQEPQEPPKVPPSSEAEITQPEAPDITEETTPIETAPAKTAPTETAPTETEPTQPEETRAPAESQEAAPLEPSTSSPEPQKEIAPPREPPVMDAPQEQVPEAAPQVEESPVPSIQERLQIEQPQEVPAQPSEPPPQVEVPSQQEVTPLPQIEVPQEAAPVQEAPSELPKKDNDKEMD